MAEKEPIGEILARQLEAIDEAGGNERYQLRELIGRDLYNRMIHRTRTADVINRWLSAGSKSKPAATRTLALAIARSADKPDLVSRIEREIGDTFDLPITKKNGYLRDCFEPSWANVEAAFG